MTSNPKTRIPIPDPATMSQEQLEAYKDVTSGKRGSVIGPFWAALHQPELAHTWQKLGKHLRFNTVFDAKYSELAILVTARRWNSELEWVIHRELAEEAGLDASICDAILEHRVPDFADEKLKIIYEYVSQLQNTGQVDEATHTLVTETWGVVGVVELTALTGYYVMVSLTLNAHHLPLPEGRVPELYPPGADQPSSLSVLP